MDTGDKNYDVKSNRIINRRKLQFYLYYIQSALDIYYAVHKIDSCRALSDLNLLSLEIYDMKNILAVANNSLMKPIRE